MSGVHPDVNEAALRHLANRLARTELELAAAVGNLKLRDIQIATLRAELEAEKKIKEQTA